MHDRRSTLAALIAGFTISTAAADWAAAQSAGTAGAQPGRLHADPPAGLLYYAKADYAPEADPRVVANPHIAGALVQVIWSEVEHEDGQCDWSELESWIQPWAEAGKQVAIRIMWSTSGNWPKPYYKTPTPRWVWDNGAKFAYYEPSRTEMPLIWDPIYQQYAWRFLEQMAARYDGDPRVLFFDITPGAETNPYRFGIINRRDPEFKQQFQSFAASDGRTYDEDLWLQTVKEWIDASARIFTKSPLLVTLNVGGIDAGDRLTTIGDYCVDRGFLVGQNGLGGGSYRDPAASRSAAYLDWSRRTPLFFEMGAGTGGRTGSLMDVMQAAERINCSFLNVYPEDVKRGTQGDPSYDPDYEAALAYGADVLGGVDSATVADAEAPFADLVIDGERWTCTADGQSLEGILVKPDGAGPFPAIIISHGLGSSAAQFGLSKAREFVKWGFVCIAPTYTHTRGAQDRSQFGASDENIRRARVCLAILDRQPEVDKTRIAAYGNSMGAFLTVALAAAEPMRIKAAAITAGGLSATRGFAAPTSEAAEKVRTPVLILHGGADSTVPPQRSELLKSVLDRQQTVNERHVWDGVGHNLHQSHAAEVYVRIRAWFETHGVLTARAGDAAGGQPVVETSPPPESADRAEQPGDAPPASAPRRGRGRPQQSRGEGNAAEEDAGLPWVKAPVEAIRTRHETFNSPTVGGPVSYLIYLPPGYDEGDERYPVLYWLHGIGGAQTGIPRMVERWHQAIEAGKCPPLIVVFVNGLIRSSYVDSADGNSPVETVSIKELIPHIDATYRTIAGREGRIIEGFSMGGAGAAKWGFRHADLFGAVSILAGALHDAESLQQRGQSFQEIYGGSREYFEDRNPWSLVRQHADAIRGRTTIRIVVGSDDGLAARNRAYHELLEELEIPHEFHEIEGVPHTHGPLYDQLGDDNWAWYWKAMEHPPD